MRRFLLAGLALPLLVAPAFGKLATTPRTTPPLMRHGLVRRPVEQIYGTVTTSTDHGTRWRVEPDTEHVAG